MNEPLDAVGASHYDAIFAHVTQSFVPGLLKAARLARGQCVLDVATGTGAAAQAAAGIVGPAGTVVAGDISPAMLDVARRKLRAAPVTFEVLDAQALPFSEGRFDAVLCQLGLMFFPDPARALAEFYRVLRAEGHVAVSVTTLPERTLYFRTWAVIASHVPARSETLSRYFAIFDPRRLYALLAAAGFRDVQVDSERREFRFVSFDDYFSGIEKGATWLGREYARLPAHVRRAVREDVRRGLLAGNTDGPLAINMEVLFGSGRKQGLPGDVSPDSRALSAAMLSNSVPQWPEETKP
jgi:ubiquinone/menaquinone biosynthesis C-methylase UbiE